MCDVTKANFTDVLPTVRQLLRDADFVCIDTEFTTLVSDEANRSSLFDDGNDRYNKLRRTASHSLPCQLGLAIFSTESPANKNCYIANVFNFYLLPRSFGPIDPRFTLQASSVQFLCKYNFDFNKVFYEGISYLNKQQETKLITHLNNNDHFDGLDREDDEHVLQEIMTEVVHWHIHDTSQPQLRLNVPHGCESYVIVEEIKQRFNDVWATVEEEQVVLMKVDANARGKLEAEERVTLCNQRQAFVDEMVGFSRLIREIVASRKPLIGHNMFMDLILLYDKFWRDLPVNYKDFKAAVRKLFPVMYDTKHIAASMKKELERTGIRIAGSLTALHDGLTSTKSLYHHLFSPVVTLPEQHKHYVEKRSEHEAGYDAYMAGVVFLHLCHHKAMTNVVASAALKMGVKEYYADMQQFVNNINLIRGTVNYLNFAGKDPPCSRPAWLVVTAKHDAILNTSQLARRFSRFGCVDIKRDGRRGAFVAVGNKGCAKDILRACRGTAEYSVKRYSVWRHNPSLRKLLWFGLAAGAGVCIWTVCRAVTSSGEAVGPS